MSKVRVIINGREVMATPGMTILEMAKEEGIFIPTLCHHRALSPVGACRVCVVEVKGQRNLQAACVFPVSDGMEIETDSPRVVAARKLIINMLFSERNHYCPYCERSGDCELQDLGYLCGVDHWLFPTYTKPFPIDATRKYFFLDHNRCVLCTRCVRACGELVANNTLGLRQRGAKTMIHTDAEVPFGESTCIACGTCLQVCPTGALADSRGAFMGRSEQTQRVTSVCNRCSVGCGMKIVTRDGNVLFIEGDWDSSVNGGLLCRIGRFDPLYDQRRRVEKPLLRQGGSLREVSWDEALRVVAARLELTETAGIGVYLSTDATNEALYLVNRLFVKELRVRNVGLLTKPAPDWIGKKEGTFADLTGTDMIMLVGANPAKDQPVAYFFVKRLADRDKKIIVVDDEVDSALAALAHGTFRLDEINRAVELADKVNHLTVIYGDRLTERAAVVLKKLGKKAHFVALEPGVNTRGAQMLGLNNGFNAGEAKVLYIINGEYNWQKTGILKDVDAGAFVVVQTSYHSLLTERADVVLPSAVWYEREGSLTNTEGKVLMADRAVEPQGDARPDWEILMQLGENLGKRLGVSFQEISSYAVGEMK